MRAFLDAGVNGFYRAIEIILVLCMATMLVMVFGNVVLRLFFNTGIDISEELPRFAFVWMTFLGGIIGLHRRSHLGVDIVVLALPLLGRKVCWAISQVVMLVCAIFIFYGTWLQHDILKITESPVAEISMLWVYGVSYVTGAAIALICISNLLRLASGRLSDDELIGVHEEGLDEGLHAARAADQHKGR
ncbi:MULTISPECIES: TRAP transporter small permease [Rhizobium/Agrobacterium group]|uniref:TRAP transporter small permease protein n=1 Tax=Rhizobium rhizogenes TaxID=359 RepID=A0A546XK26_RHIRH|nr:MULTISPECIES: TRAP transporter small permease [Rhizobium/Agrobacterium group]TRB01104.1 TRAP transporter small permease [Rhizobium rhizogenes]